MSDYSTGIFTDGACSGNPGPGGWGFVWVENNQIIQEKSGFNPDTTNNRMEFTALIHALEVSIGKEVTIYSDSNLGVKTYNEWMEGWAKKGWKRKTGPIANLDLVQKLYELKPQCPEVKIQWIKAHVGHRWNEYADGLATREL